MRSPSSKYLYGFTSTFGTSVNVDQADVDALDREIAAARAEHAALVAHLAAAKTPAVLRPEIFPYASIEIIPAPLRVVCSWCTAVITEGAQPASHGCCPACVAQLAAAEAPTVSAVERTIEETQRASFHRFLVDPATGPLLDAMLADTHATDAAIEAERLENEARDAHTDALEARLTEAFGAAVPGRPVMSTYGDTLAGSTPRGRFARRTDGRPIRLADAQGRPNTNTNKDPK